MPGSKLVKERELGNRMSMPYRKDLLVIRLLWQEKESVCISVYVNPRIRTEL